MKSIILEQVPSTKFELRTRSSPSANHLLRNSCGAKMTTWSLEKPNTRQLVSMASHACTCNSLLGLSMILSSPAKTTCVAACERQGTAEARVRSALLKLESRRARSLRSGSTAGHVRAQTPVNFEWRTCSTPAHTPMLCARSTCGRFVRYTSLYKSLYISTRVYKHATVAAVGIAPANIVT